MLKEYLKIFTNFIKKAWLILIALIAYILLTNHFFHTSCPIKLIFGLPCPGCGMSRACLSALSFHFIKAFKYHAFFIMIPILAFVIIFKERPNINKIYKSKIFWIILLILFIAYFIMRMIIIRPEIPLDYYENNLVFKIKKFIKYLTDDLINT